MEEHQKAAWLASPQYKQVTWIESNRRNSRKLTSALTGRRTQAHSRPASAQNGTPRFLIVKDGKVVANEFGTSNGHDHDRPQKLLTRDMAAKAPSTAWWSST